MNTVKKAYEMIRKNVDLKKGTLFGGLAGLAVGAINAREGLEYALYSGSKETAKCLVIGSINMGICRRLATTIEDKAKALTYATVVPAIMSSALTYGVHAYIQGTPHPVESTLPTLLSAPFFLILAARERRLHEKKSRLNLEHASLSD